MNGSNLSQEGVVHNTSGDSAVDNDYEDFFSSLSLLFTCVMLVMCVAGMLMNAISLLIFTRPTFRKRSINILLVGLSASDLCLCILAVPVFSLSQIQQLIPSLSPVKTGQLLLYAYPITLMAQTMSVWMLVAITIDRYLAVCHPFAVRIHCTIRRAVATVLLVLIFSVAYNFVRFWEYTVNDDPAVEDELQIVGLLRENQLYMIWYQTVCNLVTQFVVPLFVLCVLSLQVARTIISVAEQRKELVKSEKREHSSAKMMIYIVIVFVFCYSLSFCLNVLELCQPNLFKQQVGYLLNDVNNILIVFNSSTSFVFYAKYSSRLVA
ncbi:VRFamide receptor [Aphelenchoides avenae]|nr:VRFamide receptor [Aphelenchus avenae]